MSDAFDPARHLSKVSGSDYLEVRWRLVWLRNVHPDAVIETDLVSHTDKLAVFKATVSIPGPGGSATGHGSETPGDFRDYLEKAECFRDDTEILTKRGFKHHRDIRVGEPVLAYDLETDTTVWTPLLRKVTYQKAPVVRMEHRDFDAVVTPEHSWATAGAYRSWVTGEAPRRLRQTNELTSSDRIILSAPAPGGSSKLTPDEAAIIGWLVTDGTIWRDNGDLSAKIYQSKPEQVSALRELVGSVATESIGAPTTRTFPTGKTYECLPQHVFHLPASIARALLTKAKLTSYEDLPVLIPKLSQPARRAMLDAMMDADGDDSGYFGKIAKAGVQDAWQMLCTLEGIAVGQYRNTDVFPVQKMKRRRYVSCGQGLTISDAGVADVWCPTTEYGTWVARTSRGQIMITGNTKAIGRALGALGFGTQFSQDFADGASGRLADAPVKPRDRSTSRNTVPEGTGSTETRRPDAEPLPGLQPATEAPA
jgi:hypothetical protein